jgi:hypothetical protein
MAGRIYGTLRPAEAMGNRGEDFLVLPFLRTAHWNMLRML